MGEQPAIVPFGEVGGGYPANRAIVIVQDGEPRVVAFLLDKEGEPLRIDIMASGTIVIETAGFAFVGLGPRTLRLLQRLADDGGDLATDLASCGPDFSHLVTHPRPVDLHETLA